jgi:hypothetical protein
MTIDFHEIIRNHEFKKQMFVKYPMMDITVKQSIISDVQLYETFEKMESEYIKLIVSWS